MNEKRTVIDDEEFIEVDFYNFVTLPDLSEVIGVKSDETLLMGIS